MVNLEQICWHCRHSSNAPGDDYICPWHHDGKSVQGWTKVNGFIVRCPHFLQNGGWKPDWVARGPWKNMKPVPYVYEKPGASSFRIVCLDTGTMFQTRTDAANFLISIGAAKMKPDRVLSDMWRRERDYSVGERFKIYGYTFAPVAKEKRQGHRNYKYTLSIKEAINADKNR